MAIAIVGSPVSVDNGASAQTTVTVTKSVTSGNLLVLLLRAPAGNSLSNLTGGTTWITGTSSSSGGTLRFRYGLATSTASVNVVATYASIANLGATLYEFSGVDPVNYFTTGASATAGSTTTNAATGNITPPYVGCVVVGGCCMVAPNTYTYGSGFTSGPEWATSGGTSQYKILSNKTALDAGFTLGSSVSVGRCGMAFNPVFNALTDLRIKWA